jgi:hypothetical protein
MGRKCPVLGCKRYEWNHGKRVKMRPLPLNGRFTLELDPDVNITIHNGLCPIHWDAHVEELMRRVDGDGRAPPTRTASAVVPSSTPVPASLLSPPPRSQSLPAVVPAAPPKVVVVIVEASESTAPRHPQPLSAIPLFSPTPHSTVSARVLFRGTSSSSSSSSSVPLSPVSSLPHYSFSQPSTTTSPSSSQSSDPTSDFRVNSCDLRVNSRLSADSSLSMSSSRGSGSTSAVLPWGVGVGSGPGVRGSQPVSDVFRTPPSRRRSSHHHSESFTQSAVEGLVALSSSAVSSQSTAQSPAASQSSSSVVPPPPLGLSAPVRCSSLHFPPSSTRGAVAVSDAVGYPVLHPLATVCDDPRAKRKERTTERFISPYAKRLSELREQDRLSQMIPMSFAALISVYEKTQCCRWDPESTATPEQLKEGMFTYHSRPDEKADVEEGKERKEGKEEKEEKEGKEEKREERKEPARMRRKKCRVGRRRFDGWTQTKCEGQMKYVGHLQVVGEIHELLLACGGAACGRLIRIRNISTAQVRVTEPAEGTGIPHIQTYYVWGLLEALNFLLSGCSEASLRRYDVLQGRHPACKSTLFKYCQVWEKPIEDQFNAEMKSQRERQQRLIDEKKKDGIIQPCMVFAADGSWSHKGYKAPAFNYIAMDVSRDWHAIKEAKSKGLTELPRPRPHPPVVFLHIICKDKVVKPYERRKRRAKLHRQLPQTQVALGRSHGDNTAITGRSQSHGDHTEITAVSPDHNSAAGNLSTGPGPGPDSGPLVKQQVKGYRVEGNYKGTGGSAAMEGIGWHALMDAMDADGRKKALKMFVSDRDLKVGAGMRERCPNVKIGYDPGHIKKQMQAMLKQLFTTKGEFLFIEWRVSYFIIRCLKMAEQETELVLDDDERAELLTQKMKERMDQVVYHYFNVCDEHCPHRRDQESADTPEALANLVREEESNTDILTCESLTEDNGEITGESQTDDGSQLDSEVEDGLGGGSQSTRRHYTSEGNGFASQVSHSQYDDDSGSDDGLHHSQGPSDFQAVEGGAADCDPLVNLVSLSSHPVVTPGTADSVVGSEVQLTEPSHPSTQREQAAAASTTATPTPPKKRGGKKKKGAAVVGDATQQAHAARLVLHAEQVQRWTEEIRRRELVCAEAGREGLELIESAVQAAKDENNKRPEPHKLEGRTRNKFINAVRWRATDEVWKKWPQRPYGTMWRDEAEVMRLLRVTDSHEAFTWKAFLCTTSGAPYWQQFLALMADWSTDKFLRHICHGYHTTHLECINSSRVRGSGARKDTVLIRTFPSRSRLTALRWNHGMAFVPSLCQRLGIALGPENMKALQVLDQQLKDRAEAAQHEDVRKKASNYKRRNQIHQSIGQVRAIERKKDKVAAEREEQKQKDIAAGILPKSRKGRTKKTKDAAADNTAPTTRKERKKKESPTAGTPPTPKSKKADSDKANETPKPKRGRPRKSKQVNDSAAVDEKEDEHIATQEELERKYNDDVVGNANSQASAVSTAAVSATPPSQVGARTNPLQTPKKKRSTPTYRSPAEKASPMLDSMHMDSEDLQTSQQPTIKGRSRRKPPPSSEDQENSVDSQSRSGRPQAKRRALRDIINLAQ